MAGQDKPTEAALTAKIAELDGAEAMRLLRKERDSRIARLIGEQVLILHFLLSGQPIARH